MKKKKSEKLRVGDLLEWDSHCKTDGEYQRDLYLVLAVDPVSSATDPTDLDNKYIKYSQGAVLVTGWSLIQCCRDDRLFYAPENNDCWTILGHCDIEETT